MVQMLFRVWWQSLQYSPGDSGTVRGVGDHRGGLFPIEGGPTFASVCDAGDEVGLLCHPAGQAALLLDAKEPSQAGKAGHPAGRAPAVGSALAGASTALLQCPARCLCVQGGPKPMDASLGEALPGSEDEEQVPFSGVGCAQRDGSEQGLCQPCPPCQDGSVQEHRALLARQGRGEGRWLLAGCWGAGAGSSPAHGSGNRWHTPAGAAVPRRCRRWR